MSTQFYCVFGSEDAEHLGIDPKGWIEIHANSIEHAHQIAFKHFDNPASPFPGFSAISSEPNPVFKAGKQGRCDWDVLDIPNRRRAS